MEAMLILDKTPAMLYASRRTILHILATVCSENTAPCSSPHFLALSMFMQSIIRVIISFQ